MSASSTVNPKFSANLYTMFVSEAPDDVYERMRLAKAAGFEAVESIFPLEKVDLEELARVQKETGLLVTELNAPTGEYYGYAALEGHEKEFDQSLRTAIEFCNRLKCKKLHIMAGRCLKEFNLTFGKETYEDNLRRALPLLKENNIIGLIEPIKRDDYYLNSFSLACDVVERFDDPNLRLLLDVYHLQRLEPDFMARLDKYVAMAGHVQVAQTPHRHEPDVGGDMDLKLVIDYISAKYNDHIGLEYKPMNGTVEGLKWIKQFGYTL